LNEEQHVPITVLLADDHPIVRTGFAMSLASYGINVVGQAATPGEVLPMYAELNPDVLVLDIRFGEQLTGIDIAIDLLKKHPDARIVFLSQFDQDTLIKRTYQIGAYAFVTKDCEPNMLAVALQHAYERKLYFLPHVAERLANLSVRGDRSPLSVLQERDLAIFKLMAQGLTIAEIAEQLNVSVKTVANSSMAIKEKLCLHRPAELTRLALKHGLIEP
jgi:DNA-binding NarL/FixJ family response regulator